MHGLLEAGVRPGTDANIVALLGSPTIETVVVLWASFDLGVPVALIHPKLGARERQQRLAAMNPALWVDDAVAKDLGRAHANGESDLPAPPTDDARPLALVATSGTTGVPKLAVLSRAGSVEAAHASADNLGWLDDDRWFLCMPLAHVGGLSIVIRCLAARRAVVMAGTSRFDPASFVAQVERDRVTLASLVPTMLARVLDSVPEWSRPDYLRAVLLGGAPATPGLIARAAARRVPILTTYGLTEAGGQVTTQRFGTPPSIEQGSGSPLAGIEVCIHEHRVRVRGPNLMTGYWQVPGEHAFDADGWFTTGDLGELDERGRLHVLGRCTEMIVTGGENVFPSTVQRTLERCPEVASACVFGRRDEEWGEVVAAVLVPREPGAQPDAALAAFARAELATHERPRWIAWATDLPTTDTGKVSAKTVAEIHGDKLRRLSFT